MNAAQLVGELRQLLMELPLHVSNSQAVNDLYEHWLLGQVLEAARQLGPTVGVSWHNVDGRPATAIRLKAAPGEIYGVDWTHALISVDGLVAFEAHTGVKVQGIAAVHEFDVLVAHALPARTARLTGARPRGRDVVLGLEGKAYATTPIDVALARQVVGVALDTQCRAFGLAGSRDFGIQVEQLVDCWCDMWSWPDMRPAESVWLFQTRVRHVLFGW